MPKNAPPLARQPLAVISLSEHADAGCATHGVLSDQAASPEGRHMGTSERREGAQHASGSSAGDRHSPKRAGTAARREGALPPNAATEGGRHSPMHADTSAGRDGAVPAGGVGERGQGRKDAGAIAPARACSPTPAVKVRKAGRSRVGGRRRREVLSGSENDENRRPRSRNNTQLESSQVRRFVFPSLFSL